MIDDSGKMIVLLNWSWFTAFGNFQLYSVIIYYLTVIIFYNNELIINRKIFQM